MKWLAHLSVRRTRRHTGVNEHVSTVALWNTTFFVVASDLFTLFLIVSRCNLPILIEISFVYFFSNGFSFWTVNCMLN